METVTIPLENRSHASICIYLSIFATITSRMYPIHSWLLLSWFFFFFFILYGFSPVEFVFAFEVTQWIYFWPEKSYINVFSFGFHLCGVQKLFFNLIIMHFQLKFLSHINSLCRIPVWKEYSMGYSRICWF